MPRGGNWTAVLARTLVACAVAGFLTVWPGSLPHAVAAQDAMPREPAGAPQEAQKREPPYVLLRADEVIYDEKAGLVTAVGGVEISHENEILRADKVTYDENRDIVTATGNVVMLQPTGEVFFADYAEFTDGMKDAIVKGFGMLMSDDSRIAAAGGTRTGGVVTTMNKAVFSPCELCEEDPDRPPLWRVRAVRVIHDSVAKDVEYQDAFLELWGVPVFYTPYLSHPDPSVKRRTGFLAPSYGSDTTFGLTLETPFFWEIAPNEDLTVMPRFMSKEANVLAANYRRRFTNGQIELDGSITTPDRRDANNQRIAETDTRGHVFATGRFDHNDIWRTRFQVQHASDDTYLRRYSFSNSDERTLTTSFTTEGFYGRNYAQVSGYTFQGLRETDDNGQSPLVLPYGSYSYSSQPFANGSFITADSSLLMLTRSEGTDTRRLALNTGWHLPYVASTGEIFRLSATIDTDIYSVSKVVTAPGMTESGVTGRVFPQVMGEWRLPLARADATTTQVIEPRAAVVLAPNGGNPDLIPNEDSSNVEFDHTNLFSLNRFSGTDRVESGTRFIYGVNWNIYGNHGGAIETFLGQSYRLREQAAFGANSGLEDQLSDVVGRIRVAPNPWIDFLYRFRFDPKSGESRRNEVGLSAGPSAFRVGVNYLFLDEGEATLSEDENEGVGTEQFGDREEVVLALSSQLNRFWRAGGHIRENLAEDGGTIDESVHLTYEDECFTFRIVAERTFTQDRDLRPTDSLMFQLIFKHLGEFSSSG